MNAPAKTSTTATAASITPATVEVPAEAIIEAAARSIALAEIAYRFSFLDDVGDMVRGTAMSLLGEATGLPDDPDTRRAFNGHPLVVEAHARAEELAAEWAAPFAKVAVEGGPRAERIRSYGWAYAALYNDSEIEAEIGVVS